MFFWGVESVSGIQFLPSLLDFSVRSNVILHHIEEIISRRRKVELDFSWNYCSFKHQTWHIWKFLFRFSLRPCNDFVSFFSIIMGVGEGGIGDKGDLASLPTFLSYIFGGHLTVPGVGFFGTLNVRLRPQNTGFSIARQSPPLLGDNWKRYPPLSLISFSLWNPLLSVSTLRYWGVLKFGF